MERIKKYLEEAVLTDEALKAAYDPEKLPACWNYILSQGKKLAINNCAVVEDGIVYKWARDYMFGDISEEDKQKSEQIAKKASNVNTTVSNNDTKKLVIEKVEQDTKPEKKTAKHKKEPAEDTQPSLFDDLFGA